jgi:hypothetical protein
LGAGVAKIDFVSATKSAIFLSTSAIVVDGSACFGFVSSSFLS